MFRTLSTEFFTVTPTDFGVYYDILKSLDSFVRLYIKINSMILKVAATLKRKQRDLCDCINNRLMSLQSRIDIRVFQCCHSSEVLNVNSSLNMKIIEKVYGLFDSL